MSKAIKKTSAVMSITMIAISELAVSDYNVRKHDVTGIKELAQNIKQVGLINPLTVSKQKDGSYGVIAGQRRWLALNSLVKDGDWSEDVPCIVVDDSVDDVTKSLSENIFTKQMDPLDKYKSIAFLRSNGKSYKSICDHFGMSMKEVKQYIALGNLSPLVVETIRGDDVNLDNDVVFYLTRYPHEKQDAYIKALFKGETSNDTLEAGLFLNKRVEIDADYALFDLNKHKIVSEKDLFSDEVYVADAELFWKLQMKEVAKLKRALIKEGWKVKVVEPDGSFYRFNYSSLSKDDGGTYVINVMENGRVIEIDGLDLDLKDDSTDKTLAEVEDSSIVKPTATARQELPRGSQTYYSDWHYQMVRDTLAKDELQAMRVFVAHLVSKTVFGFDTAPNITEDGNKQLSEHKITKRINERVLSMLELFGLGHEWSPWQINVCDILDKLKDCSMQDLTKICTTVMLATIEKDTSLIEKLGVENKINPLAYWKADSEMVDTLKSKGSTWGVAGELLDDDALGDFTKAPLKKRREILVGSLKDDFIPPYMAFPISQYDDVELDVAKYTKPV